MRLLKLSLALGLAGANGAALPSPAAQAAPDPAAFGRTVTMQRFMVSATRVAKNPWYYASLPGYEVLSRASEDKTVWWLDARRRGEAIEDGILPKEWLPVSVVPHTIIIDDTDLETLTGSVVHSQPIVFGTPADAMTWGHLADRTRLWADRFEAHDSDTYAVNSNVFGVDTNEPACEIGLERLLHCTPALPRWVVEGLLDGDCGLFREGFMPVLEMGNGGVIRQAAGPGTLWVSIAETQKLLVQFKKDRKAPKEKRSKFAVPALGRLFSEAPVPAADIPLWESEAALFMRWGLTGPGHDEPATARAFLAFAERARHRPVDENDFRECFGFGYAVMEKKLSDYLKEVLAEPNTVDLVIHGDFDRPDMREATSDQIGRILGDWLRMEGDAVRTRDPEMGEEFLYAAGRVLERAYRQDNGLPPDTAPLVGLEHNAARPDAGKGSTVVMKPFVVTATHLHDPGLLAVYGLYEHDSGNDLKAREFLRAALISGAVRPRANLVLSESLYAEAMAHPEGGKGKLGEQQLATILAPLEGALVFPPPSDAYAVVVETWLHSDAMPRLRDVHEIDEGVALFPRNTGLAYQSALVCAKNGFSSEASDLLGRGLLFVSDDKTKGYFTTLRSTLDAKPSATAR